MAGGPTCTDVLEFCLQGGEGSVVPRWNSAQEQSMKGTESCRAEEEDTVVFPRRGMAVCAGQHMLSGPQRCTEAEMSLQGPSAGPYLKLSVC